MTSIKIRDLSSSSIELFADSESYLDTMSGSEVGDIHGGSSYFCSAVTISIVGFTVSAVVGYYARP